MKRFLLIVIVTLVVLAGAGALFLRFGLGAPVPSPGAVFDVAGGMAAKLGCSARYITKLSPEQLEKDLASYSSAYGWVTIKNDDGAQQVEAHLGPGRSHFASYRAATGCTLNIGDTSGIDAVAQRAVSPYPHSNSTAADAMLAAQLEDDNRQGLNTRALLIMRDGQIIGEANSEGFTSATPHLGWSMGKSLIAMLYGRMEADGLISASETGLFERWRDERQNINIENLLRMSSGLAFEEIYAPGSDATRMLFNEYSASEVALDKPLAHPPGTHFAYSSGTTNILARLLFERLGGTADDAYAYLHSALLKPLGMAHTVVEPDPSGVFVGSSYVYASARDWAQLGHLMVAGGIHQNERLLSQDWIDRATRPNTSANEPRYGYQFWLNSGGAQLRWPDLPADAFAMQGNRAQIVLMIPSQQLVIVRLGWSSGSYPYNATFSRWLNQLEAS